MCFPSGTPWLHTYIREVTYSMHAKSSWTNWHKWVRRCIWSDAMWNLAPVFLSSLTTKVCKPSDLCEGGATWSTTAKLHLYQPTRCNRELTERCREISPFHFHQSSSYTCWVVSPRCKSVGVILSLSVRFLKGRATRTERFTT